MPWKISVFVVDPVQALYQSLLYHIKLFTYVSFQRQYVDAQAIATRSTVTAVNMNDDDEGE